MLKKELKNGIFNPGMLFALAMVFYIFFRSLHNSGLYTDGDLEWLYYLTFPMAVSGFVPFACIYPALPHSTSFCEEYNSGFFKSILHRTGFKRYYFTKLFSVGFSGALSIFIPFVILFTIIVIFSQPVTDVNNYYSSGFYEATM